MRVRWIAIAWLCAGSFIAPALAQQPAASAGSASANADLAALVGPRAAELSNAGVQKIAARTDKGKRNIQLLTKYGAIYFGWPKGVQPVAFDIVLGQGSSAVAHASGYSEATKARYAAALDALIPEALDRTAKAKVWAERPKV
jgi:hypothetical protein